MAVKITSLIEKMVAIVAPHRCLMCGIENNILCSSCSISSIVLPDSFCVLCTKPSKNWQLCHTCELHSGLHRVWVGTEYQGVVEELIHRYKFERAKAAHQPLAQIAGRALPVGDWVLVPIPTAPSRVRQRGYDQTYLIAQELANQRGLPMLSPLRRLRDDRQVGASRAIRLAQSRGAFESKPGVDVKDLHIVLVDDVCTTGATLSAAARLLKQAGAKEVNAVVCAWQAPKA